MVLYLKYRPQSLDDLIGQTQVKETLLNAFKNKKLAHAYLLVGPRGTGKTSTARILAKMVNCSNGGSPCNKCDNCVSITDGSNLDLIEIDAASNRGIDDIRSLRENVKLAPTASPKKIYIIDEVHMLTTEAFNALLKTLEEPPQHVMFILATTEVAKIPQTILSRVQKLDFNLASLDDLYTALKKVAEFEKIKVGDEALKLIAKKAEGSFRDAVKLLDQLSSGGGEITVKMVTENLNNGDFEGMVALIKSLAGKDSKTGLMQVIEITKQGVNIKEFILSLMDLFRNLVYIKSDLANLAKENYDSNKYPVLVEVTDQFSMGDLTNSLNQLQEALERLKTASIASLPLEIAVVEICSVNQYISISADQIKSENQNINEPEKTDTQINRSTDTQISSDLSEMIPPLDISRLQEKWTFVLETVRADNFSLEALLRTAKISSVDESRVFLEVPYAFHQRILESQKSKDLLEHVFSDVLERPVKIATVLGTRPQRIEDIANVEIAQDDEVISLASEIFNGKLID